MSIRFLLAVSVLAIACAACGGSQYIIGTKTGQLLVAHGKPSLDDKSGLYTYKDSEGKKATIAKDEVSQIMER